MPGMMENLATVNSLVRTILALVVVGGVGAGGLVAYRTYYEGDIAKSDLAETKKILGDVQAELQAKREQLDAKLQELDAKNEQIARQQSEISDLNATVAQQAATIERQATAMRLLKRDQRKAIIAVLDQTGEGDDLKTTIRWVELDENDQPIDERTFDLKGDIVKVDAWVVKFDDQYIEEADLIRGTSICLFRRIHGEFAQRDEVHVLDEVGSLPRVYRRGKRVSDFERDIWDDFWEIANDPDRAEEMGIRAAHGEVVYNKVRPGKKYKLELRASGGLTMKPLEDDEADPTAKPAA